MPFWKRTVEPRRLLPSAATAPSLAALPLAQLHEVCGQTTLALLRQLADLCGHSAALLGDLEGRLLELSRRAHRLRGRLRRVRGLLRPGASSEPGKREGARGGEEGRGERGTQRTTPPGERGTLQPQRSAEERAVGFRGLSKSSLEIFKKKMDSRLSQTG